MTKKIKKTEKNEKTKETEQSDSSSEEELSLQNEDLIEKEKKNFQEFDPFKNPPKLVLIQGPPKSGKTTLMKSLIKHYTGSTFDPVGPVTIRVSQKQRLTLMECSNEIGELADQCKIPDLILMTIDASLGFEMQTFEALTVMQNHSFPRCIGVVSHMDFFKKQSQTKKAKKQLKKRFAVEVTEETRLFFISSFQRNSYNPRDVHNLARLISVINPRETEYRKSHPHFLVDRMESLGSQTAFYGYLRGGHLSLQQPLFVSGFGLVSEFKAEQISDPCPLVVYDKNNRTLRKREKLVYAPQSQIGQCIFDKDGDYITVPKQHVVFTKQENEEEFLQQNKGVQMIREIQQGKNLVDSQLNQQVFLIGEIPLRKEEEKFIEKGLVLQKIREASEITEKVQREERFFKKEEKFDPMGLVYGGMEIRDEEEEIGQEEALGDEIRPFFIGNEENSSEDEEFENEEKDYQTVHQEEPVSQDQIQRGKYVKVLFEKLSENQVEKMKGKSLIISQTVLGETNKGFLLIRF